MTASAWMVRAGRHGERAEQAVGEGLAIIGWTGLPDLSTCRRRHDLRRLLGETFPNRTNYLLGNWAGQLWRFSHLIAVGDLVVLPLKAHGTFAIGESAGSYQFRPDAPPGTQHVLPVTWRRTDVAREEFQSDLRNTLGSLLTVFQLTRHDAPARIEAIGAGKPDPGWRPAAATADSSAGAEEIWAQVAAGQRVMLSIRDLLGLWGFSRRTTLSLDVVATELDERGIVTRPPFTRGRIDSVVEVIALSTDPAEAEDTTVTAEQDEPETHHMSVLIRNILPDDRPLVTINSDATLLDAITTMLGHGVAQLPVLDGDHVLGAVSWESVAKAQLSKSQAATLRDATTSPVHVVDQNEDLFGRIDEIERNGFIFVKGDGHQIVSVLTANDLARQFGTMARPFSLLSEAELRLRSQVQKSLPEQFAKQKLKWATAPTFGQYKNILEKSEAFEQLGWPLDHLRFLELLATVVAIRNDLMHVSKDPLTAQHLNAIESFVKMLRLVDQIS